MEKTIASMQAFLSFLPRAPKFPHPLPLLTPAMQAKLTVVNSVCGLIDCKTSHIFAKVKNAHLDSMRLKCFTKI